MRITLRVKPNSKKGPLVEETDAGLLVYIREPAVEGRANKAVVELLSNYYGVPKTRIQIMRGATGREKVVEVSL